MFKKLRNKMLLINMISTFCLIVLAFSVIFAITYSSVERDIDEMLFRTFSFHRPMYRSAPPETARETLGESGTARKALRDARSFSVFVKSDGTIHTDSILGENSERYKSVAQEALKQKNSDGEFRSEQITWRFITREFDGGAKIIAIADITTEKNFLIRLVVSFAICAVILLVLIFLISLYFANKSLAPIKETFEKQKQFVGDASHELKTPLTAINANIDVLLAQKETGDEQEKWLRNIKSEVNRLTTLTQNLLFMAKMDGEAYVSFKQISLSEAVERAVLNLEAVAFEKGVRIKAEIENNVFIKGNEDEILRLGTILIDNAVKYSPDNKDVTVCVRKLSKTAELSVHNSGEPIADNEIGKIFDRFYRADKSRSSDGYGLGLAMAKEITVIHKGKISVLSTKDTGTKFTVQIPLQY